MNDLERFLKERNAALRSLDLDQIQAYMRNYGITVPPLTTPDEINIFWASIHKARTAVKALTEEERETSRQWLRDHGFYPGILDAAGDNQNAHKV